MPRKQTSPTEKKDTIGFRLSPDQMEVLEATVRRTCPGMSVHLYVKSIVLEQLGMEEAPKEESADIHRELQELRREIALATEALLVSSSGGMEPITREQAKEWVRKNFNLGRQF